MLKYDSIEIGDQVHWAYSEEGDAVYTVIEKYTDAGPDTVLIISDNNSEYEVFLSELF